MFMRIKLNLSGDERTVPQVEGELLIKSGSATLVRKIQPEKAIKAVKAEKASK